MRTLLLLALLLLPACDGFDLSGDPCPLTITNGTSDTLWFVYVREAGGSDWGEDLLDSDTLADGDSIVVDVEGGTSSDVQGVWPGGETFTQFDVAACNSGEEIGVVLSLSDQD